MYYAKYKEIRNGAWQCLADFEIDRLPVDILSIAKYANVRVVKNSMIDVLKNGERGRAFYDNDKWIIVYDDSLSVPEARMTVSHELGHIFLGHDVEYAEYFGIREFKKIPVSERQADDFAARLLCPACVIWGLGLDSAEKIASYCRVPLSLAKKRYKRICVLNQRNKFLTSDIEKEIYINFRKYIQAEKASKDV